MRRITWNDVLVGLSLVRFGQELGTDCRLTRAVFDVVTAVVSFFGHVS